MRSWDGLSERTRRALARAMLRGVAVGRPDRDRDAASTPRATSEPTGLSLLRRGR